MNIQIDVGEIIIDGVKISESQFFDLRLALERELSGDRMQTISHNQQPSIQVDRTSCDMRPNSSPQQLASGIASSILGTFASRPMVKGE
jgi:hypothetical protein